MSKKLSFLIFFLFVMTFSLPGFGQEEEILHEPQVQSNPIEELKKIGYTEVNGATLLDERAVKIIQKMFREGPLRKESSEDIKKMILDKSKGSRAHGFLIRNPKVTNTLVDLLKDEHAMSSLLGIFLRKSDLKKYFYIWLGIMVLGYFVKRIFFSKKWKKGKRTVLSICLSLLLTTISLSIFYNMFHPEISPAVKIITKNFRS